MKKLFLFLLISAFVSSAFSQERKISKVITNLTENASIVSQRSGFIPTVILDAAPPQYAIPGAEGFWDYVTNGSNLNNIVVLGQNILVSFASTDSLDPRGQTKRVAYYIVSTDGGATWGDPLAVSTLPSMSGYPEIHTYLSAGVPQVVISGRKYNASNSARGGAWKDAFLGLGSFQGQNVPGEGRDFFGATLTGDIIGGLSSVPFAASNNPADTLYFVKYTASSNSFGTKLKIGDPALNQTGGSIRYRLAVDGTGNNLLALWYKDSVNASGTGFANSKLMYSTSSNGGTSWGSPQLIQQARGLNSVLAPGDTCGPWFGIDAVYKPNTTSWGVVWNTLYPKPDNTGLNSGDNQACKVLFYSPSINGGVPTIVAGSQNMTILSDTNLFVNRQNMQVGLTPVSHPSLAYSEDGTRLFCAFSAFQPGDSLEGFTFNDIWYSYSDNGGQTWVAPKKITDTHTDDELYPTISMTGNSRTQFHLHYQSTKGPGSQSFSDNGINTYRVYQCYQKVLVTDINNVSTAVPERFSLKQNYPNPFNPTTSIRFDVAKASKMTLKVYDMSGKLVQTLFENELVGTGTNEVTFEASKLSSGVYFYTLSSDNYKETKKMMLVK